MNEEHIKVIDTVRRIFNLTGNPPRSIHLTALAWMVSKRQGISIPQAARIIQECGRFVISESKEVSFKETNLDPTLDELEATFRQDSTYACKYCGKPGGH